MELLFFDWDYFPFGGFTGEKLVERLVRKLWRERSDGALDYFPRGFGEPGFQIDKTCLAEITAALRTPGGSFGPFIWIIALLPFVYLLIFKPATALDTFVNGLAGGAVLSALSPSSQGVP